MNRKFVVLTGMRWTVFQIALLSAALGIASSRSLHAVTPPAPGPKAWIKGSYATSTIKHWTYSVDWNVPYYNVEGTKIIGGQTVVSADSNVYNLDGGIGQGNRVILFIKDSDGVFKEAVPSSVLTGDDKCWPLTSGMPGGYDGVCYLSGGTIPVPEPPTADPIVYHANIQHYDNTGKWVTDVSSNDATFARPLAADLAFANFTDPIVCESVAGGRLMTLWFKSKVAGQIPLQFYKVEVQWLNNMTGMWQTITRDLELLVPTRGVKQGVFSYSGLPAGNQTIRLRLINDSGTGLPEPGVPTPQMTVTCPP